MKVRPCSVTGGVLTLTWYTYMCLSFGALFQEIWYSNRGGGSFHQRRRSSNYINWVYFGQITVKSTQFGQNWVLFFQKWYVDGWEIRQKIGIGKVLFSTSSRYIHIRFWRKYPPPPVLNQPLSPNTSSFSYYTSISGLSGTAAAAFTVATCCIRRSQYKRISDILGTETLMRYACNKRNSGKVGVQNEK